MLGVRVVGQTHLTQLCLYIQPLPLLPRLVKPDAVLVLWQHLMLGHLIQLPLPVKQRRYVSERLNQTQHWSVGTGERRTEAIKTRWRQLSL